MELLSLKQVLNFTDADLAANRAGQLSDDQRKRLQNKRGYILLVLAAAITVIPTLILTLNVLPMTRYHQIAQDVMALILLEPILMLVVVRVLYEYGVVLGRGSIAAVEGNIKLQAPNKVQLVDADEVSFSFARVGQIFEGDEGKRYRFYCIPRWLRVVSAERIDDSAEQMEAE